MLLSPRKTRYFSKELTRGNGRIQVWCHYLVLSQKAKYLQANSVIYILSFLYSKGRETAT